MLKTTAQEWLTILEQFFYILVFIKSNRIRSQL